MRVQALRRQLARFPRQEQTSDRSPLVLHSRRRGDAQLQSRLEGKVDVAQDLASQENDVGLALLEYAFGFLGRGDEAYGANEEVGHVLLDVRSKGNLFELSA